MNKAYRLAAGLSAAALLITLPLVSSHALASFSPQAPAAQAGGRAERTTWFFYKVKWGHQEEFVDLFQKNHYPVLKEEIKAGRMTSVRTFVPTNHGDGRADWTFAVAITFKDTAAMMGPSGEEEIVRRLYPNRAQFLKEEQRRFEILDAHWDVPLNELDIDNRRPSGQ
jgi:hypothetical protein